MPRAIAQIALTAPGLCADPVHAPVHAPGSMDRAMPNIERHPSHAEFRVHGLDELVNGSLQLVA